MTKTIKELEADLEKTKAAWIIAALAMCELLTDAEQDAAQVVLDAAWDALTTAKTALDQGKTK
jgi:hypothetical protein